MNTELPAVTHDDNDDNNAVFTLAQTPYHKSCDNGQCCRWSVAALTDHRVSMTTMAKAQS